MNVTLSTIDKTQEFITLYDQKISVSSQNFIAYSPQTLESIWDIYEKVETVYEMPLASTIVYKGKNKKTQEKCAIKYVQKARLKETYLNEFIKNELAIHHSMSQISEQIVKVNHYFEEAEGYYMVMEYTPMHGYFEELLERVKFSFILIRNINRS